MKSFQNKTDLVNEMVIASLSDYFGKRIILKSVENLGGGCINHASKIVTNAGEFFLKWNSDCTADIFIREAESLKELNKAVENELIMPAVYASKLVDSTPGYLVLEYLKPGMQNKNQDEILGKGLAKLHQFTNAKFGFYHDNYCGATLQNNRWKANWVDFFIENRISFLLNLIQRQRPFSSPELKIFEKLITRIPELIPRDSTPVLIHGDLWSGNYMISENGPALIDPAAYYADREMEFAIITMFGGFSQMFYDAYNEVNPLSADWKLRNQLYQIYHVLNHYYLFGDSYGNQALRIAQNYI